MFDLPNQENIDKLSSNIGVQVDVCRGIIGCKAVKMLHEMLITGANNYDHGCRTADGLYIFGKKYKESTPKVASFNQLRDILRTYTTHVDSHSFSLRSGSHSIGAGIILYPRKGDVDGDDLLLRIEDVVNAMVMMMSMDFYDKYDMRLLPQSDAIYGKDEAVTLIFMKKGSSGIVK